MTGRIDSYSFGNISVDGTKYNKDLIVFPDKILPRWWRDKGHLMTLKDAGEILDYKPEVLIIGTGISGIMKVDEAVVSKLKSMGIECIIEKSTRAVEQYNKLSGDKRTVLAIRLTC